MDYLIVTGMSGAGKTQASNTLEDLGYYCIDNMPAALIPKFAELYTQTPGKASGVAFIIDVRGEVHFDSLLDEISLLKQNGCTVRIIYIDCEDSVLLNRYKEARRIHPLVAAQNITVTEALKREREMMRPVREKSDYLIDTSRLTNHQLRDKLMSIVKNSEKQSIVVTCMSFGFKYGIAGESDLVFDVRCFPNPYYDPELRNMNGLDTPVKDFLFGVNEFNEFSRRVCDMIDYLMPLYIEEGRSQLIISFGCTGGKHRSVVMAEELNRHLNESNVNSVVIHRDIIKKFEGDK